MKVKGRLKLKDHDKKQVCVLCNETFTGWGNNPHPLAEEGVACNSCNFEKVVPARMKDMDKDEIVKEEKLEDGVYVDVALNTLIEVLGAETFARELAQALPTDLLMKNLEYIAKKHDVEDLIVSGIHESQR